MQARKMMNEILELKATISQQNDRSVPLSVPRITGWRDLPANPAAG
jgi:hypothetical protein